MPSPPFCEHIAPLGAEGFPAIPSDYFVDHSPRLYAEILIELAEKEEQIAIPVE